MELSMCESPKMISMWGYEPENDFYRSKEMDARMGQR